MMLMMLASLFKSLLIKCELTIYYCFKAEVLQLYSMKTSQKRWKLRSIQKSNIFTKLVTIMK